jgi:tRNA(Ile)-lysidine synthase
VLSAMKRTLEERGLCARGERVLVAVSGGPDSTALLHGLRALAGRLGLEIEAATVDHGLRAEAAKEAAAVAAWCQTLDVPCTCLRVDVKGRRGPHVSWQDAARRARLEALDALAEARGCARVALGHTADDQAETVLFRILRGTGVAGLAGIPYRRGRLVRPLLDVRRGEVLRYLRRRGLSWIDDPSNADRRFARARIRHEWLPALARENPRVVEALLALAADARGGTTAAAPGLSRGAAATVARLVARGAGTRMVSIAGGEQIEVSYGRVTRRPRAAPPPPPPATEPVIAIAGSGTYTLGTGRALEVRFGAGAAPPEAFDLEALALPLGLRAPRPGDRMRPRGGRGTRKLSDLFIDAKVPRATRAGTPILVAGDGTILFVPGLRPADAGRPVIRTRRWIQVWPR